MEFIPGGITAQDFIFLPFNVSWVIFYKNWVNYNYEMFVSAINVL